MGGSQQSGRVCLVLGVVLILASGIWTFETWRFQRGADAISGVVVAEEKIRTKHGIKTYQTVAYRAGGTPRTVRLQDEALKPGNSVALLLSPTDPTDARDPDALWDMQIAILIIGAGLAFVGALYLPRA